MDRAEIRTALQNWQMGLMMNDQENKGGNTKRQGPQQYAGEVLAERQESGGWKGIWTGGHPGGDIPEEIEFGEGNRGGIHRAGEGGVDARFECVEKAREWYLKQVAVVQEKMKYLGRMGHVTIALSRELLLVRRTLVRSSAREARTSKSKGPQVNRHLATLTESWERGGLPLHMNLAVHHYPQAHQPQDLSDRLKQQNRLLTEEVSKKSERISALEQEKASLIQVLQMRSAPPNRSNGQEEAVF
ncbi:hypothetical protein NQ317_014285 [Molorchus minor]|uniref:Uncharacterized protein n=1 Tax=Molorchus minor TaxID=1323400 RepID=A0ABQ9IUC1_9CUCU|nr:hypothetical protein NQ317_014285 [Molorchus minor]